MPFSIKFLGRAVDLCVLLNSAVCGEGLQLIPIFMKVDKFVRSVYNFVSRWRSVYISSNKQTNYSKISMLLCLSNTFQAVMFQLKTPRTPTTTRVSAWHQLYSPSHLLIDIRGLICFLLRKKSKLQFSVASCYQVLTAHHRSPFSAHRRLALWFAFSVTCGSAGSHRAACDAVVLFGNCLHLRGQAVYWPRSEGNAVLRNVGSYSPNDAVASVHPRITCIGPCIALYVKGFAYVT